MSKRKIINDPIYGLINFPFDLLYDLIDHPHFQRLRRISQMGLSNYVYPGATHSRFAHALGALHLMTTAIDTLRNKGIDINEREQMATCIAILLHDIGHGPFSHALEGILVNKSHENISLDLMQSLEKDYGEDVSLAIDIFKGDYPKKFLSQLVSSQLDMDRMDYLTRDSYYSGVAEGVIGYKRIIAMLNVVNEELVVEEKGLYSIEKFLVARHIMYWQVYLHKASMCSEQMLKNYVLRLKDLLISGHVISDKSLLHEILLTKGTEPDSYLDTFVKIDDHDVFNELKNAPRRNDKVLGLLANDILDRKLFKIELSDDYFEESKVMKIGLSLKKRFGLSDEETRAILIQGKESTRAYNIQNEQIKILQKTGSIVPASELMNIQIKKAIVTKHFFCYPK